MSNQPLRMALPVLISAMVMTALLPARGQDRTADQEKPVEKKVDADPAAAEGGLEHPKPVPVVNLLPTLKTVPIGRAKPSFNVQFVDATLLPRDKQGIWVLDFGFKPMRMRTFEPPGKGRQHIHYLYYRVVNHTGKPRDFVPQFTLVTDTGKRYEESVIPSAVKLIQGREDTTLSLHGAVDIAGVIAPSTKEGVDDTVFGVAMWENIDPHADKMSIYVRGLSDGWKSVPAPDGGKATIKYKTLRIDLIRRGDARNLNEKEIQLADPSYEWVYW